MKRAMRALVAIAVLALGATTQLSCSVNDYCLHCAVDDGGVGDGGGSNDDDGGGSNMDASDGGGCVSTGLEECDGKDNDCNGLVDDGVLPMVGQLCSNQQGACAGGVYECSMGKLSCTKAPMPEMCDGVDNNCDGTKDEGDPGGGGKCGTDMGECVAGQYHCNAQTGQVECFGFIDHTNDAELCDQKDNDCDGKFDEGLTNMGVCGPATDVGECVQSHLECQAGTPICVQPVVFPKFEECNTKDDDCDNKTDEIFNLSTDPKNCTMCGKICDPPSKTCINTNNNTNGAKCTTDTQCPGGSCVVNSQPRCNNGCTFACNAGFKDIDLDDKNGCEYRCFATGAEECDGVDNDCDGTVDESVNPPAICLSGGECGTTAPVAKCTGAGGWTCTYTGDVQFPETKCDGKNNDCDANTDEAQPNLNVACSEKAETACNDMLDNDNDGFVNDGCPAVNAPETGTQCNDTIDNDGDMRVNDGCPAKEERGVCKSFGTYQCDPDNLDGPAKCKITVDGQTPAANETCDAKDNDCDGNTDEGGANGTLIGQEWVPLGNGKQIMKYEASKPDASASDAGSTTNLACSKLGVKPWTNVTYLQAQAACQSIGASLCSESTWHRTCSRVLNTTYPVNAVTGGIVIEAEDYYSIGFGQTNTTAETACNDAVDDDGDGWVNDGCAALNTAETTQQCANKLDDDGDGRINDGCVARGPTKSWVPDYTAGFSSVSALRASPNTGTNVTSGNATTQAARVDYLINFPSTGNWRVWVRMFAPTGSDDQLHVGISTAAPPQTPTRTFSVGTTNAWTWVDAGVNFNIAATGNHYLSIYMADDGVKIDQIVVRTGNGTPNPAVASKGNKWAYATNANMYDGATCNGDDYDTDTVAAGDQDDILKTGLLAGATSSCYAEVPTATPGAVFDMSGNVKEWTLAHAPGENPIRGGASNNTADGISCPLNFTLADDAFFFPNVGFRCCR